MDTHAPSLTLVVDRRLYRPRKDKEPLSLVEAAIAGGVTQVQLRAQADGSDNDLILFAIAQRLREMTTGRVPFIVTGDLELAERCYADGVLLTEQGYKPEAARKFLRGMTTTVGCYVQSVTGAARAERGGADYVQVGPVFGDRASGGGLQEDRLHMIQKVKDAIHLPIVAFGGISSRERAAAAIEAGANGIAVTNAILAAQHPELAAQDLRDALPG